MIVWPWLWVKVTDKTKNEITLIRKKEIVCIEKIGKELKFTLKNSTELSWTQGE